MKVTLKTLNQRTFELEVGVDEGVEDLICKLEDVMGRENLYKLIYAGKMMKEGEKLSDYNMTGRLPVIVMATQLDQYRKEEREAEDGGHNTKRIRTESEDSGFGDSEGEHFVTDREFSIALEVVMACQHFKRDLEVITRQEMVQIVETTFPEEEAVQQIILTRLDEVEQAHPNKAQFKAFILDIQSMYEETKEIPTMVEENDEDIEDMDDLEEDEGIIERNMRTLIGMGFSADECESALNRSSGSLQVALDLLLPRSSETPPALPSTSNPLSFLRDLPEFQYLRFQVIRQPTLLKPFLISFGESHPEVMREINQHKEEFVAMLYEQTGGCQDRYRRH